MNEVFFVNFSRLLTKDQIKKGSFSITLATGSWEDAATAGEVKTLADHNATADSGYTTVLGGDYGLLYTSSANIVADSVAYGNIFYQAGVAVITASLFQAAQVAGAAFEDHPEGAGQDFSRQRGDLGESCKSLL